MPARLHFSNSLAALADRLIENLGTSGDPFASPIIAYSNSAARDWLKARIAEKTGIAVNLGFETLEKLLWNRLAELDRFRESPDRQPARMLEAVDFQGMILSRLAKNPPAALRDYLEPGSDPEPRDEARRLCQLAGRLASLFREYEYSRVSEGGFKGLAETWNKGRDCFGPVLRLLREGDERRERLAEAHTLEAWQREVYQGLFRPGEGLRDRWGKTTGVYRYTLPQYAEMVLGQPRTPVAGTTRPVGATRGLPLPGTPENPQTFHLFGLSQISPFHRDLIRRLADAGTLGHGAVHFEIHALNPCAEYWEDARLSEVQLQEEELPERPEENLLLARFGKPGRETVALWNQVAEYDFSDDYRDPEGKNVLGAMRRALLHRRGPLPAAERLDPDPSLQIWSAPDPYAEAEAIKADLAEVFAGEKTLRPEDVGLILADPETYLPVIETVFADLPLCLPESGSLRESSLLRGFRALLELATGPFRPGALLDFLENPCASGTGDSLSGFGEFLAQAGFQEGWDEKHRTGLGAAPGSLSTWEEAVRRALLGLIMDPADPGLEKARFHPASGAALGIDREELSGWLEFLEKLRNDLGPFRDGERKTFFAWGKYLRTLLSAYFSTDGERAEAPTVAGLNRFFLSLELWGWEKQAEEISHHLILGLIDDHFREPGAPRGSLLPGGLRIGSLELLRGLPFRRVYVLGLNGGDFPRARAASAYGGLDLRSFRRVLGESDPAARELYAFLESMAATEETLVLSYSRREDPREGRNPIGASYAITGLIAYLESDILKNRFIARNLESAPRLFLPRPPKPEKGNGTASESKISDEMDLRSLGEFLRNPVEQACFRHFRLYGALDEEEDDAPALSLDKWETRDLLASAWRAEWIVPGSGPGETEKILRRRFFSGQTPPPPYSDLESERIGKRALDFAEHGDALRKFLSDSGLSFAGALRLGHPRGRPLDAPILSLPAFDAHWAEEMSPRIGGAFPCFFRGENASRGWGLLADEGDRGETEAYLLHLCAAACGGQPIWSGPGHLIVRPKKSGAFKIFRLPSLEGESARRDLRMLLGDFRLAPELDHLPLGMIRKLGDEADPSQPKDGGDWREAIESRESEDAERSFTPPGPRTRTLRALAPMVPADAGAKIQRRLLPFLRWRGAWEKTP